MRHPITALALVAALLLASCGPNATLTPNPATLDFGTVYIGLSATATTTWTSTYNAPIVASLTVAPTPPFDSPAVSIPQIPANGTTGAVTVSFAPTAVGPFNGSGNVGLTTPGFAAVPVTPTGVALKGSGAAQTSDTTLSVTGGNLVAGAVLDFGKVNVGATKALTFNVANASATQLTLTVTVLGGGPYTTAPAAIVVPANGSLAVTVAFAPTRVGVFPGAVEFTLGAAGAVTARAGTAVTGAGVAPPPPPPPPPK
jgi:hypothetical protein